MAEKLEKSDAEWRSALTPEQYAVCRARGTEPPFSGEYWDCQEPGNYHCRCCRQPLFDASHKFDSGTGWPSFDRPVKANAVEEHADQSHGMVRTEVRCSRCDAHLGHVFPDGPPPTRRRYCINSVSLVLACAPDCRSPDPSG